MNRSAPFLLSIALWLSLSLPAFAEELNATLAWSDQRELGTTVSGRVSQFDIRPGMLVKKGEMLIQLDQRGFDVRVNKTHAAREHARLLLEEAQREQERAIELYDRTVLSDYDRQQADIGLASAESVYAAAKADFEQALIEREYSQIRAPYDALVLAVDVAPGEVVVNQNEPQSMITLARSGEMLAVATVNVEQLENLGIGQEVEAAFRGSWVAAKVNDIGLSADQPGYRLAVKLVLPDGVIARAGEASAIRLPD